MDPLTAKPRLATAWLGGCSGCHMSLLDLDLRLLDLAARADLVYSPIMDVKTFPENVDVALVEGAIANEDHLHDIRTIRERTRVLVSLGDCAVTGNVTAMRNTFGDPVSVLQRAYIENVDLEPGLPVEPGIVPPLLGRVVPIHEVVPVDVFVPGCPPSADLIYYVLDELLAGRRPVLDGRLRYG